MFSGRESDILFVAEMKVDGEGDGVFSYEAAPTGKGTNSGHHKDIARINLFRLKRAKQISTFPFSSELC